MPGRCSTGPARREGDRSGDGFAYTPFEVAKRIFDAPKMNLYPIPQAEIVKSGGVLDQNPGW